MAVDVIGPDVRRPTQELEVPPVQTPQHQPNVTAWIQIALTMTMALLAAFVWLSSTSRADAAKAAQTVADDVTEIKTVLKTVNTRVQDVCEWRAATQEVLVQIRTQVGRNADKLGYTPSCVKRDQ